MRAEKVNNPNYHWVTGEELPFCIPEGEKDPNEFGANVGNCKDDDDQGRPAQGHREETLGEVDRKLLRLVLTAPTEAPLRMLPMESSGKIAAPRLPQVTKYVCAFRNAAGAVISAQSDGALVDKNSGDCISFKVDDYAHYVGELVRDKANRQKARVCGTTDEGVKIACTSWEFVDEVGKAIKNPTREGYARLGFKIGAWSGGQSVNQAKDAKRGDLVPIQAYIGEDFAAGFYNATQRQGAGDRIALILLPIPTSWWNSPSHIEVREGRIGDLVQRGLRIADDQLAGWDKRRLSKIDDALKPLREARQRVEQLAQQLETARRAAQQAREQARRSAERVRDEIRRAAENAQAEANRLLAEQAKAAEKIVNDPQGAVGDFVTQLRCGFC